MWWEMFEFILRSLIFDCDYIKSKSETLLRSLLKLQRRHLWNWLLNRRNICSLLHIISLHSRNDSSQNEIKTDILLYIPMNIKSFPIKYTPLIANEPEGKWVANILVDFSEISFVIFFSSWELQANIHRQIN